MAQKKRFFSFLLCIVLTHFVCNSYAQQQTQASVEENLVDALLSAQTAAQQETLLTEQKEKLTPSLCDSLFLQGRTLIDQGDLSTATKAFELSRTISQKLNYKLGMSKAIRGLGTVLSIQGKSDEALLEFEQSLKLAKEIQDKSLEALVLRSIASTYYEMGNRELALQNFHQSLAIADAVGDKEVSAGTMNNLANMYMFSGDYAQALWYLTKALSIQSNKILTAHILTNIAVVYDLQGNYSQALDYYQKSLNLWEELGHKAEVANVLNNMGDDRLLGSYDTALEYNKKALVIAEETGDKKLIGRALANIGSGYLKKGDFDQAITFARKSLAIAQEVKNPQLESSQWKQLARAYYSKTEYVNALEYSEKAISISKEIDNRQNLWAALEIKGKAYRALKEFEKAYQAFHEAIMTIEDWRSLIAGGEVEQLNLFAEKASVYHEMIDLLVTQKKVAEAFSFVERCKARVLLDVLHSGKVEIAKSMTAEEIKLEKELGQKVVNLNELIFSETHKKSSDRGTMDKLNNRLQEARLEFESFRTKLYVNHPELKVKRGETNTIRMEQTSELMNPKTALVEFLVTDEKTYLFVLSTELGSVKANVYSIPVEQENLTNLVQEFRQQMADRNPKFQEAAFKLHQLLLKPAYADFDKKTKLVIAPDGILWELPFQALQQANNRYLLEEYEMSFVPSFTVYREMREMQDQTTTSLMAFANPALNADSINRLKITFRSAELDPLPEAEKEVKNLQALYGMDQSKVYVGEQAREEHLKKEGAKYGILHFATHAILNDSSPLYSQVVLAQGEQNSDEDGLLEAWEIMNLNLNSNLVVLSACETGLGKLSRGEGMIGLSWAFFIAGTSATIVSQWKVLSSSTSDLMLEFHKNLHSKTLSKASALRLAALKIMQRDEYRHPFYWAPFVVIGE